MNKINNKLRFILGITGSEPITGADWKLNFINNGVPNEVVIMQLKSLLKNFENKYFGNFDSKLME